MLDRTIVGTKWLWMGKANGGNMGVREFLPSAKKITQQRTKKLSRSAAKVEVQKGLNDLLDESIEAATAIIAQEILSILNDAQEADDYEALYRFNEADEDFFDGIEADGIEAGSSNDEEAALPYVDPLYDSNDCCHW